MKSFAAQDKHANYKVEFVDNVIIATIKGSIGESLTKRFCRDVEHMVELFPAGTYWAYLGDMSECDGYTGQAEPHLLHNSNFAKNHGCLVDAYVIPSPVAREQLRKVRIKAELPGELNERLFDNVEQAKHFLTTSLPQIKEIIANR